MTKCIPVRVKESLEEIGTIAALPDSSGPHWEDKTLGGVHVVLERRYNQIVSVQFASVEDARSFPSFEPKSS